MSFYGEFRKIRNRFKNYSKAEIFDVCLAILGKNWNKSLVEIIQLALPNPMTVLLILKWGMIYGESHSLARKRFDENAFNGFYSEIGNLSPLNSLLDVKDPKSLPKFVRATMSHQIQYQKWGGCHGLVLLEVILDLIGSRYDVDKAMYSICGLDAKSFIDLEFIILEGIVPTEFRKYNLEYFKNLFSTYGKANIQNFLNFISSDLNGLEILFGEDHRKINNPEFECALLSPLYKKPLYKSGNSYVPFHKTLIDSHIEYRCYDILKGHDAENFCSPFGSAFEEYVAMSLSGVPHVRESEIRKLIHKDRSSDFLIPNEKGTIILEVKSAEMYYLTRHDPQTEYFERTLQNSLISGYQQIITTAQYLQESGHSFGRGKEFFGIIVTFKDLMLGNPEEIWNEFMRDFMKERLTDAVFNNLPIAPERIFVISAYEYNHMIAYAEKKKLDLWDCAQIVLKKNEQNNNQTFFFNDHLNDIEIGWMEFRIIKEAFQKINERIGEALKTGERTSQV